MEFAPQTALVEIIKCSESMQEFCNEALKIIFFLYFLSFFTQIAWKPGKCKIKNMHKKSWNIHQCALLLLCLLLCDREREITQRMSLAGYETLFWNNSDHTHCIKQHLKRRVLSKHQISVVLALVPTTEMALIFADVARVHVSLVYSCKHKSITKLTYSYPLFFKYHWSKSQVIIGFIFSSWSGQTWLHFELYLFYDAFKTSLSQIHNL